MQKYNCNLTLFSKIYKRLFIILVIFILPFISSFSTVFGDNSHENNSSTFPNIVSGAAILVDNKNGTILYNKNDNKQMYPASTTKIMTAILTLEHCNLNDVVTISTTPDMLVPEGYSVAFLQENEQLTVEQLLQLLLVHSANDAANVLAKHVGGSVSSFVSMMNTKANELNLDNTNFTNAYGLHDENHYTTASDLAKIMQYCVKNQDFRRLAGSASCTIPATNLYKPRQYISTNEMVNPNSPNYYPYLSCGKTGYTKEAGDCLVSCNYKDDIELICVILGGKSVNNSSSRFLDTKKLCEYVYNNFSMKTIVEKSAVVTNTEISKGSKETKNLDVIANNEIQILLENNISQDDLLKKIDLNENLTAPISQGDKVGTISYEVSGTNFQTDLIASHDVEKSKLPTFIIEICIGILFLILIIVLFYKKFPWHTP